MQHSRSAVKLTPLLSMIILLTVAASAHGQTQSIVNVIVFRSSDTLTLYLPDIAPAPVNITGLRLEATTATGVNLQQELALLPAFRGLPYDRLPTPICFHITRTISAPMPLSCQTITTLTQTIADADVFWYDLSARGDRTLVMYLGGGVQICAAGATRCDIGFPALPTPTATNTSTYTPTVTQTGSATFTLTDAPVASLESPIVNTPSTPFMTSGDRGAYVRRGPSMDTPILETLSGWQRFEFLGWCEGTRIFDYGTNVWYLVRTQAGTVGFISVVSIIHIRPSDYEPNRIIHDHPELSNCDITTPTPTNSPSANS